jgi:hypothetical protein
VERIEGKTAKKCKRSRTSNKQEEVEERKAIKKGRRKKGRCYCIGLELSWKDNDVK